VVIAVVTMQVTQTTNRFGKNLEFPINRVHTYYCY
jgi:hypothetical protein